VARGRRQFVRGRKAENGGFQMMQERVEGLQKQMPQKNAEEMLNIMLRICPNTMMVYGPTSMNGVVGVGGGMAGGLSPTMCPNTKTLRKNGTPKPQHKFC
jgi:hypothetical protein